jgi:O-antigen ligase
MVIPHVSVTHNHTRAPGSGTLAGRLGFIGAVTALPVAMALALATFETRPTIALVLILAPAAIVLARRSIAYPVALGGIPTLVIALLGRDPFPHGLITALFFVWTVLAIVLALQANEHRLPMRLLLATPVLASLLLAVELVVRLSASQDSSYGSTKLKLFILENVTMLVAGALIAQTRRHVDRLLSATLVIAGASGLILLWRLSHGQAVAIYDSRFTISVQQNPIQLGRQSGDGLIIATYLVLAGSRSSRRAIAAIMVPVLVITLLAAGSRGPVLGTFAGLVALFAVLAGDRSARRRIVATAALGLSAAFLVTQLLPGQSLSRSLSFLTGASSGLSSNGRSQLWSQAWHLFTAHPWLGIGTGSFAKFQPIVDYPHNMLLESAVELGLLGLFLVVAFVVTSWLMLSRARRFLGAGETQTAAVIALFTSALVNAMFSGDIPTNASLWLYAGLGVGLASRGWQADVRARGALSAHRG